MHSVGIHSALAIKRQRKRRDEQKRARERRYSIQSSESGDTLNSPHGSTRRKYRHTHTTAKPHNPMMESQVVTSIGMLHIGVVFIVFGVFLLGAGVIPDDTPTWDMFGSSTSWWNEVTCTGLFSLGLGVFLLVLNCLISKKEEEDLEDYVQRQLTRSRSGHRLERDVETGVLTTRHTRKALAFNHHNGSNANSSDNLSQSQITPVTSEMVTPTTPGLGNSGEMLLEKIMEERLEEDSCYGDERTITGISPIINDKKYLLGKNGYISGSAHITRI